MLQDLFTMLTETDMPTMNDSRILIATKDVKQGQSESDYAEEEG